MKKREKRIGGESDEMRRKRRVSKERRVFSQEETAFSCLETAIGSLARDSLHTDSPELNEAVSHRGRGFATRLRRRQEVEDDVIPRFRVLSTPLIASQKVHEWPLLGNTQTSQQNSVNTLRGRPRVGSADGRDLFSRLFAVSLRSNRTNRH